MAHKNLEDRIYINDQRGEFYRLQISLPHTNGSCVAVADYNDDGFDDFFVGSRNVPGAFGVAPVSFIIKNVGGERLEIAGRMKYGMVNDAIWYDMNNDDSDELIVISEWNHVKVFTYSNDTTFVNIASDLGIPDVSGLFNCAEIADVNQDGKPDLFLGNIGRNSSWQLNDEEIIIMHLADYDNNSFVDPIIFTNYFGEKIPFADKMTLKSQIPSISKVFPTFNEYASFSSVNQLGSATVNSNSEEKTINVLSSILLLSDDLNYDIVDLPSEVQQSSVNDFLWIDDGVLTGSLLYVGNSDSNSHSLGQTLGSRGGILSAFDQEQKQFLNHNSLNLPLGTVSKHILQTDDAQFIVINNDDVQYQIQINVD